MSTPYNDPNGLSGTSSGVTPPYLGQSVRLTPEVSDPYATPKDQQSNVPGGSGYSHPPAPDTYGQQPPNAYNHTPGGYSNPYPQPENKSRLPLIALISSFFIALLGLILGIIGLKQSNDSNDSNGKVMSIIAIAVSTAQIVSVTIYLVAFAIALGGLGGLAGAAVEENFVIRCVEDTTNKANTRADCEELFRDNPDDTRYANTDEATYYDFDDDSTVD